MQYRLTSYGSCNLYHAHNLLPQVFLCGKLQCMVRRYTMVVANRFSCIGHQGRLTASIIEWAKLKQLSALLSQWHAQACLSEMVQGHAPILVHIFDFCKVLILLYLKCILHFMDSYSQTDHKLVIQLFAVTKCQVLARRNVLTVLLEQINFCHSEW